MKVWLDAQLPPGLCHWLGKEFQLEVVAVRDLGLRESEDPDIFNAAAQAGAVVMSKDADFAELVRLKGPPPQVLWVTVGNTTNREMRRILAAILRDALDLLESGEPLVEISTEP